MALKISLKQNERIIVNGAVLSVGKKAGEIVFLNHARILHQHHVLTEDKIKDFEKNEDTYRYDSWFYYLIQLIYIDPEHIKDYLDKLTATVDLVLEHFPDKKEEINTILGQIEEGELYQALNTCRDVFPNCLKPGKTTEQSAEKNSDIRAKLKL